MSQGLAMSKIYPNKFPNEIFTTDTLRLNIVTISKKDLSNTSVLLPGEEKARRIVLFPRGK